VKRSICGWLLILAAIIGVCQVIGYWNTWKFPSDREAVLIFSLIYAGVGFAFLVWGLTSSFKESNREKGAARRKNEQIRREEIMKKNGSGKRIGLGIFFLCLGIAYVCGRVFYHPRSGLDELMFTVCAIICLSLGFTLLVWGLRRRLGRGEKTIRGLEERGRREEEERRRGEEQERRREEEKERRRQEEEQRQREEARARVQQESSAEETYYDILGVSRNATQKKIKKAYLQKINKYHPDKIMTQPEWIRKQAEEMAKKLNVAFEVLGNPKKRREYDNDL